MNKTTPLNETDIKTYGKKGFLDNLFDGRKGYVELPADISLEGKDLNEEEI